MFEAALQGTKGARKGTRKSKGSSGWRTFGNKDANRWKKEGGVSNMLSFKGYKKNKWYK